MQQPEASARRPTLPRFVRVLGTLWLGAIGAIIVGALLAPHIGRITDSVLHLTTYRDWTRVTLDTNTPYFDLSSPVTAIKSYYSALYRGDGTRMERLTTGAAQRQMRARMAHAEAATSDTMYRSYLYVDRSSDVAVVITETFHLFWKRGLRFALQKEASDWRIAHITVVK